MYLDGDIDIYLYYNDNSNNRNYDSYGVNEFDNRNGLMATSQKSEM